MTQVVNAFLARVQRIMELDDPVRKRSLVPLPAEWCTMRNRGFCEVDSFTAEQWNFIFSNSYFKGLYLLSCVALNAPIDPQELAKGFDLFWESFDPMIHKVKPKDWWHVQTVDILYHSLPVCMRSRLDVFRQHTTVPTPFTSLDQVVVVDAIEDPPGKSFGKDIIGFQMDQFVEIFSRTKTDAAGTFNPEKRVTMDQLRQRMTLFTDNAFFNSVFLVFGMHTLSESHFWTLPPNSVIFNYECVYDEGVCWCHNVYRWALKSLPVVDFSCFNAKQLALDPFFNARVTVCPPSYTPLLQCQDIGSLNQKIPAGGELVFMGSITERRKKILMEVISNMQRNVHVVFGEPPRVMLKHIPADCIVINIHHSDKIKNLETVRLLQLMTNDITVVSESAKEDEPVYSAYKEAGLETFDTVEELVALLKTVLARTPEERKRIASEMGKKSRRMLSKRMRRMFVSAIGKDNQIDKEDKQ